MQTIQEIMKKANRPYNEKSFFIKSINKVIANGMKIQMTDYGRINKRSCGHIYNVKLSQYGRAYYVKLNFDFKLDDLAIEISNFVKSESYKKAFTKANQDVDLLRVCKKCKGNCILPQYIRICSGICFECSGTGLTLTSLNTLTIK